MGINFSEAQEQHAKAEKSIQDHLEKEKAMHANIALCAAILEIIHDPKTNGYAKGYAEAYFSLHHQYPDPVELKEAKKIQILYILNNITHWRGNRHSEIRKLLKENTK
jgi:hypothetical protein